MKTITNKVILHQYVAEIVNKKFFFLLKDVKKFDHIGTLDDDDIMEWSGIKFVSSAAVERCFGSNVAGSLRQQYAYCAMFN